MNNKNSDRSKNSMPLTMEKLSVRRTVFSIVLAVFFGTAPFSVFAQTAEKNTAERYVLSGYEHLQAKKFKAAAESFENALNYNDGDAGAHLGLGTAYFYLREDRLSERELNRAAELDPRRSTVYQLLGELAYRRDDIESAVVSWKKAAELDPSNAAVRARLERIQREQRTEKDFNRDVTSHFLIKYEGREKIEAGRIVLRILEDAYGEIGRALSYYPSAEIQVILYSGRQFREVTEAPGWSGGIFDGKIRIPIGGIEEETPGLRRLLYHEYTHAAVRSLTPRVPTWLNEGLAQYFEGREIDQEQRETLKSIAQAGKLPSLKHLEGSFTGLSGSQAAYAYLFSLSAVSFLVDEHGLYRIKGMLDELAGGADTGKALSSAYSLSCEEVDRAWKRSLE